MPKYWLNIESIFNEQFNFIDFVLLIEYFYRQVISIYEEIETAKKQQKNNSQIVLRQTVKLIRIDVLVCKCSWQSGKKKVTNI